MWRAIRVDRFQPPSNTWFKYSVHTCTRKERRYCTVARQEKRHTAATPTHLSVKGVELCGKRHALICPRSSFAISPKSCSSCDWLTPWSAFDAAALIASASRWKTRSAHGQTADRQPRIAKGRTRLSASVGERDCNKMTQAQQMALSRSPANAPPNERRQPCAVNLCAAHSLVGRASLVIASKSGYRHSVFPVDTAVYWMLDE